MSISSKLLRWGRRGLGLLLCLLAVIVLLNLALTLMLFGPQEGFSRIASDWERIQVAHRVESGELTPDQAFEQIYGAALGSNPTPAQIRRWLTADLEQDEPMIWDVTLAQYLTRRFGAIDGRSLPPGVYLGAGPIGPDAWPGPIFTHYLVFPRHGYVLVVPPPRRGAAAAALEATASQRQDFRESGDGKDLYAVVTDYQPGAFDFPTAGEPVHDLFMLTSDPEEIDAVAAQLRSAARHVDQAQLKYALLSRNSNSALSCFLRTAGLPEHRIARLRRSAIVRLRLPGIARPVWKAQNSNGIEACTSRSN
jgi:hypothetical protein